jgi:hypothetical protein
MGRVAQASLAAVGLLTPAPFRAATQDDEKRSAAGHRKHASRIKVAVKNE